MKKLVAASLSLALFLPLAAPTPAAGKTACSCIPQACRDTVSARCIKGILSGLTDGSFGGSCSMSRDQVFEVLTRLCGLAPGAAQPETPVTPTQPETPAAPTQPEIPPAYEPPADIPASTPSAPTLANGTELTEDNVRAILNGLRSQYPEGMRWTNDYHYRSNLSLGGRGCEAFGLICSDAAFGSLPVTAQHSDFSAIRAGDLLRINNDSHTVVVLEKRANSVIVAEGNYNESIHWDREISRQALENGSCTVRTRYPGLSPS